MTLDYGNHGIFLIIGNAGFISSAVVHHLTIHCTRLDWAGLDFTVLYYCLGLAPHTTSKAACGDVESVICSRKSFVYLSKK